MLCVCKQMHGEDFHIPGKGFTGANPGMRLICCAVALIAGCMRAYLIFDSQNTALKSLSSK